MPLQLSADQPLCGRFELQAELGQGGFGRVYSALDLQTGKQVALKVLHRLTPDALIRFKTEFRALSEIHHPNVLQLGELLEHDGQWLFTMQLLQGTEFLPWVRHGSTRGGHCDEQRLRHGLRDLVEGCCAIHAAGVLHRDIKSENILVTEDGQAILLDFGLATDVDPKRQSVRPGPIVGTAAAVAPEQLSGEVLSTDVDWYGVGVLLFEALTGRAPFVGPDSQVVLSKIRSDAPRVLSIAPDAPTDLAQLCDSLLERDPARRPSSAVIRAQLGLLEPEPNTTSQLSMAGAHFVGRTTECRAIQEQLHATADAGLRLVVVAGESGIGKTALVQRFVDQPSRDPRGAPLVLWGRCHVQERVPYKAFDGVVDSLARWLSRLEHRELEALARPDCHLLGRLFPVLAGILAFEPRDQNTSGDAAQLRLEGFDALVDLLGDIGQTRPLVICIDDVHWADRESVALLEHLLERRQAVRALLLVTVRSDVDSGEQSDAVARILERYESARLNLGPLSSEESRRLGEQLLGGHDASQAAGRMAELGRGHPFFIAELARGMSQRGSLDEQRLSLGQAIQQRVDLLDAGARRVLSMLALASLPLPATALSVEADQDDSALRRLRVGHFVRLDRDGRVACYHDRIRRTVLASLDDDSTRELHGLIARGLLASPTPDPEALARHLAGAGDREQAAHYARLAASRAERSLAFDRAADLYQQASELYADDRTLAGTLQVRSADMLARAGQGIAAAERYLASVGKAPEFSDLDLERSAAEQLLRSGNMDEGRRVLEVVLQRVGLKLPASPRRALASLVWGRIRLHARGSTWVPRDASEVAPQELARIDAAWCATIGLSMVDVVRAADFQAKHLLLALAAGEPYRLSRALSTEASHRATAGARARRAAVTLLEQADRCVQHCGDPHGVAIVTLNRGITDFLTGHRMEAHEHFLEALALLQRNSAGVAWEITTARTFLLWGYFQLGQLTELTAAAPRFQAHARATGDQYAMAAFRSNTGAVAWLVQDQPGRARDEAEQVLAGWSRDGFHFQNMVAHTALSYVDLYQRRGREAVRRIERFWPALERSLLLRVKDSAEEQIAVRGRVAVSAVEEGAMECGALAEASAAKLYRMGSNTARGHAASLRAALQHLRGHDDRAVQQLQEAHRLYALGGQRLHVSVVDASLGELLGGASGEEHKRRSAQYMASQKVRRPELFRRIVLPGFST